MSLTASQRQHALRQVATLETSLGVPQAVYVSEHGVTLIADPILAARWKHATNGTLPLGDGTVCEVIVTEVEPLAVA